MKLYFLNVDEIEKMNCSKIHYLKWMISVSSVLVLAIGALLTWVGYSVQASEFVQVLQFSYTGYIVVACGLVLIITSFLGMVGGWKQNKLLLSLFILLSIATAILLIVFGGILIYLRNKSLNNLESKEACITNFEEIDKISRKASEAFCTINCPCSLDPKSKEVSVKHMYRGSADNMLQCNPCESIQLYNANQQNELIVWLKANLGVTVKAQNCTVSANDYKTKYFGSSAQKYMPLITWIERQLGCSGLCTSQDLYFFSNVNNGKPSGTCYSLLKSWVESNFFNFGVISMVLGLYQFLVPLFAAFLCCSKRPALAQQTEADISRSQMPQKTIKV